MSQKNSKEKHDKPIYEPPIIKDLSAMTAAGGNISPLGTCTSGDSPFSTCGAGYSYADASGCSPTGGSPSGSQCWPSGSSADAVCTGPGNYA